MKLNKTELQEALSIVKPGLASKEIIEQTTSFAFFEGRVITYNDEISISHPIGDIDFEGAVKAEELYGLLSRMTKDEVDITIKGHELKVTSGRIKAGLKLEEELFLPIKELPTKFRKLVNPDQFNQFVTLAAQTCSKDMSIPRLTCVFVENGGKIIGADGFRLIQCMGDEMPVEDFLIPASSAFELVKINVTRLKIDGGWVHFKNEDGTVFSCRRLKDDYVKQEKIDEILSVKKKEKIVFPKKIEHMLDLVKQFAKRGFALDESVEVLIKEGKILLRAEAEETKSWVEEKASIKCNEDISFAITPLLFEYILKMTHTCILDKSITKMKFIGSNWEYVVMLKEGK